MFEQDTQHNVLFKQYSNLPTRYTSSDFQASVQQVSLRVSRGRSVFRRFCSLKEAENALIPLSVSFLKAASIFTNGKSRKRDASRDEEGAGAQIFASARARPPRHPAFQPFIDLLTRRHPAIFIDNIVSISKEPTPRPSTAA